MVSVGGVLGWLTGPGRRRAWRRRVARKALAAACAGAAVLGVLGAARSSGERATAPVLVAARSLKAGAALRVADVRVVHWPAETVSAAWAVPSVAMVEGRVLAGPLASGEPVTNGRLLGPDLLEGQPPGTMAVHVPLSDPVAQELVGPGDRVDLLAAGGHVLAQKALLLAVDRVPAGPGGVAGWGTGALGASGAGQGAPGVTIAVDAAVARRVAAYLTQGMEAAPVALALHRR